MILLGAVIYFGWSTATELMYVGDGKYEVVGLPPLTDHKLTFGNIDISKAGEYRYSFRGFSPHTRPILMLDVRFLAVSTAVNTDVCIRTTLTQNNQDSPVYSTKECVADAASRYSERTTFPMFFSPYESEISRFKKYNLVVEVVGNDDRLSAAVSQLFFSSGWK